MLAFKTEVNTLVEKIVLNLYQTEYDKVHYRQKS